jgi:hypothetical protein
MTNLTMLIKAICVLVAAGLIGNWFLAEVRKAKAAGKPWYAPYLSLPGLLILVVLMIPVIFWFLK